jgi:peptidoglycan/xylan/chitin deacetylase (PgdA/CDA1 family)
MKKFVQVLIVFLFFAFGENVFANENRIIVNGTDIGVSARGNLLPLRNIVEHLNGTISWNENLRQTTVRISGRTAVVSSPVIVGGRTMVTPCFFANELRFGTGFINNSFIITTATTTRVPVITYHHILPDERNVTQRSAWTISTQNFEQQMNYLAQNGFYTPTIDEFEAFLLHGRPLPQNSVIIHFDDGYYSNYVYAAPILRRHGLRAVIFPITHLSEELGENQPPLNYDCLTYAAVSTLRTAADVFETASHTHNLHREINGVRTLLTASHEEIISDTLQSFEFVSNHTSFAYPGGQVNNAVIAALRETGVTMAFTVNRGYVTANSNQFRLPRFLIFSDTTLRQFQNIVNGRA